MLHKIARRKGYELLALQYVLLCGMESNFSITAVSLWQKREKLSF